MAETSLEFPKNFKLQKKKKTRKKKPKNRVLSGLSLDISYIWVKNSSESSNSVKTQLLV